MNKYVAIAHSFCDACVNGNTCKGTCKRVNDIIKLAEKYEKLTSAYDRVCASLSHYVPHLTKDEIKETYLNGSK